MNDNKALNRAEIIAALRCKPQDGTECDGCPYAGTVDGCDTGAIMSDAGALLEQDAEPSNDPLTLEALRGMDGDKIHIRYIGTCRGFFADEEAPYYSKYEQYVQKYNGMLRACDLPLKYYGDTWLAYRHKEAGSDI